jgi:hypothetical protein
MDVLQCQPTQSGWCDPDERPVVRGDHAALIHERMNVRSPTTPTKSTIASSIFRLTQLARFEIGGNHHRLVSNRKGHDGALSANLKAERTKAQRIRCKRAFENDWPRTKYDGRTLLAQVKRAIGAGEALRFGISVRILSCISVPKTSADFCVGRFVGRFIGHRDPYPAQPG